MDSPMREMAALSGLMLKLLIVWLMSCGGEHCQSSRSAFIRGLGTHRRGVLCEKHFGGVCRQARKLRNSRRLILGA